jgi:hypothetical protein
LVVRVALAVALADGLAVSRPEHDAVPVAVADADHPLGTVDRLDACLLVAGALPTRRVAEVVG